MTIGRATSVAALFVVALAACADLYEGLSGGTPASRAANNRAKSDYERCEDLTLQRGRAGEIEREKAAELDRRDADCSRYGPALDAAAERQRQEDEEVDRMFGLTPENPRLQAFAATAS